MSEIVNMAISVLTCETLVALHHPWVVSCCDALGETWHDHSRTRPCPLDQAIPSALETPS